MIRDRSRGEDGRGRGGVGRGGRTSRAVPEGLRRRTILMKVLIAEDDRVSRRLLQGLLEKWGYRVVAAADGAEAWHRFQEDDFPLVISDWMMSELDGLELVRRIRSSQRPGY